MSRLNLNTVTAYCKRNFPLCLCIFFSFLALNSFSQALTADAGSNTSVCANDSVPIGGNPSATGGTPPYTYSWSPATGLDDATVANPNAFPSSTTPYTLTVRDGAGSISTSAITVTPLPASNRECRAGPNHFTGNNYIPSRKRGHKLCPGLPRRVFRIKTLRTPLPIRAQQQCIALQVKAQTAVPILPA